MAGNFFARSTLLQNVYGEENKFARSTSGYRVDVQSSCLMAHDLLGTEEQTM